jgi:hypothetical protein
MSLDPEPHAVRLDAPRLSITAIVIDMTAPRIASDAVEQIGRQDLQVRPCSHLELATILPEKLPPRCTPQSLPLRERVWLAQRIALARFLGVKWADVARLEGMSERTLRYHLARWKAELEREQQPTSALLVACQARMEAEG